MKAWILILTIADVQFVLGRSGEKKQDDKSEDDFLRVPNWETPLKAEKKCNNDWSKRYQAHDTEGHVLVSCGHCSIYNINVTVNRDTKKDNYVCTGLTAELFSSSLGCLWKNDCMLRYTPSYIVWTSPRRRPCVGELPGTIDVGFSCLQKGTVIHDLIKQSQSAQSQAGLLRSHTIDAKTPGCYPRYLNRFTLDLSPPATEQLKWKENYFVMIHVISSRLAPDDRLILRDSMAPLLDEDTENVEITSWRAGDNHTINATNVYLEFSLSTIQDVTESCHGFLLCFQWFEADNSKASAEFTKTLQLCKAALDGTEPDFPKFDLIQDNRTCHPKGVLRSHPGHPWNYPRPAPKVTAFIPGWTSSVHQLNSPREALGVLKLQVQRLDLGRGDDLVISADRTVSIKDLRHSNFLTFHGKSVTFNLTVHHSRLPTGNGFQFCYRWESNKDRFKSNPCDDVSFAVNQCKSKIPSDAAKNCGLRKKKENVNSNSDGRKPGGTKSGKEKSPKKKG